MNIEIETLMQCKNNYYKVLYREIGIFDTEKRNLFYVIKVFVITYMYVSLILAIIYAQTSILCLSVTICRCPQKYKKFSQSEKYKQKNKPILLMIEHQ